MRKHLRGIVEGTDTRAGRAFDIGVMVLIAVGMAAMTIATLPQIPDSTRRLLAGVEHATLVAFAVEYLLRLFVAQRPIRYATSFFGIVDLVSTLPVVFGGFNSQAVRVFRLLRLVRLLKLARYNRAVRRIQRALALAREEIVLFFGASMLLLFVAAVGIYEFEHDAQPDAFASIFHAMWWAVATLTTVGYGDVYPITAGGRMFTFAVLVVGLGVVAAPAGLIAAALTKARDLEDGPTTRSD